MLSAGSLSLCGKLAGTGSSSRLDERWTLERGHHADPGMAAEQRLRLVIEAAPNAIVMVGRTGVTVMMSAETERARTFGHQRAELLSQPVRNTRIAAAAELGNG